MEPSKVMIRENGGQEPAFRLLEVRPFRPFKSSEEYLWAMKEDLAEWLKLLYGLDISAETFCDALETGVVLCQHANNVRKMALEYQRRPGGNGLSFTVPPGEVICRTDVSSNTFHARDNVSNFISFCRALRIKDCLLFETDDLVMRKNEKSVILCLLELARRGSKVGMPAPLLVQMEEEIDREIADECELRERGVDVGTSATYGDFGDFGPKPQVSNNDLKSLDEMVRDLVNRCTCPTQFFMERISEGKYRIGDSKLTIYVRILRSHVMVRVGGGWDTLAHYLDKHDPCRCRQGHRAALSSKLTVKFGQNTNPAQTHMEVTYLRSPVAAAPHPSPFLSAAAPGKPQPRSTSPMSLPPASSPPRQRRASTSSTSSSSHKSNGSLTSLPGSDGKQVPLAAEAPATAPSSARNSAEVADGAVRLSYGDSSSEHSDEGYRGSTTRLPQLPQERRSPPKALLRVNEGDGSTCAAECCSNAAAVTAKSTAAPLKRDCGTASIKPPDRRRRSSGEHPPPAAVRRMPRSRSNDGGDHPMELSRNQAGRYSYRTPRSSANQVPGCASAEKNNTWTFRSRARPPLGADTYSNPMVRLASPRRSLSGAPGSKGRFCNGTPGLRSLQTSPTKDAIPSELLKEILNSRLDPNEKVDKIQSILNGRQSPPSLQSPDSGSEVDCDLSLPQIRCLKISPRKDNRPNPSRESKIPMPKYEAHYSLPC